MINDHERERHWIELVAFKALGLVEHRELPDGSAELYYPQPNRPEMRALERETKVDPAC